MNSLKWLVVLVFITVFLWLMSSPMSVLAKNHTDEVPIPQNYLLKTPDKCLKIPKQNEFYSNRVYFKWSTKTHPKGYGERLGGFEHREGRIKATVPGLHALFTAPASLFGWCDWWPENLTLLFTIENQVIMASTAGWSVDMSAIGWGTKFAYWWNLDPTLLGASPDSEMAVFYKHTHWSGGSGDLVNDTTSKLAQFMIENDIEIRGGSVNAVSLGFAHKFRPIPWVTFEYQFEKYIWQVSFKDFINDLGGILTPSKDRKEYRFSGSFQGGATLHIIPVFDVTAGIQALFSSKERLYAPGFGVDLYTSAKRTFGVSWNYRLYRGMSQRSLNTTPWGLWTPAIESEIKFFLKVDF